jgi:hypothetical protein
MKPVTSEDVRRLVNDEIADEVLQLWNRKSMDYGEQVFDFDVRAQALELNRKNGKIKDALWHGRQLQFESIEEILMDMIGHCYITIARLRLEGDPNVTPSPALDIHVDDVACHCGSGEPAAWCRCGNPEVD